MSWIVSFSYFNVKLRCCNWPNEPATFASGITCGTTDRFWPNGWPADALAIPCPTFGVDFILLKNYWDYEFDPIAPAEPKALPSGPPAAFAVDESYRTVFN